MNITIREAQLEDAALLAELNAAVQKHHAEAKPKRYKMPVANNSTLIAIFENYLQSDSTFLHIAELDSAAVGYIVCKIIEREENPFTVAFKILEVDQISVNENYRGQGIGQMLMDKATELAKEHKIKNIVLAVRAFNEGAIRFYKRLGFEVNSLRMMKQI
jgi:diamine N-acetyltransferase